MLMANFPTPASENLTEPTQLLTYLNEVTGFWLGSVFLIAIFVISFLTLLGRTKSNNAPFAVASFMSAIAAIFLKALELINDAWLIGAILVATIGFASIFFEK